MAGHPSKSAIAFCFDPTQSPTVAHHRQFGHWEGDLILFKLKLGQTNVTSLVERVSRFTVILKTPNKRTKPVMGKIMRAIKDLPLVARRSIKFDRTFDRTFDCGAGPSDGQTYKLRSGHRRGSVISPRPGKREPLRTKIVVLVAGYAVSATSNR